MEKTQLFKTLLAGMVAVATPIYVVHEGEKLTPYKDVVGVLTVCSGETRGVQNRPYTKAECTAMTQKIMDEFGTEVAEVNPSIIRYPSQWASHTIFAANIGKGGYRKSSVLSLDLKGNHRAACRYMLNYKYAGGKVFQGLVNRRAGTNDKIGEYELCLADAVERDLNLI
jgi:lysozyme